MRFALKAMVLGSMVFASMAFAGQREQYCIQPKNDVISAQLQDCAKTVTQYANFGVHFGKEAPLPQKTGSAGLYEKDGTFVTRDANTFWVFTPRATFACDLEQKDAVENPLHIKMVTELREYPDRQTWKCSLSTEFDFVFSMDDRGISSLKEPTGSQRAEPPSVFFVPGGAKDIAGYKACRGEQPQQEIEKSTRRFKEALEYEMDMIKNHYLSCRDKKDPSCALLTKNSKVVLESVENACKSVMPTKVIALSDAISDASYHEATIEGADSKSVASPSSGRRSEKLAPGGKRTK